MLVNPISTLAVSNETRLTINDTQNRLAAAQKEVSTGRHADISAELGTRGAALIGLRNSYARIEEYLQGNSVIAGRMEVMQTALETVGQATAGVRDLIVAVQDNAEGDVIDRAARDAIDQITMSLNSNFSGRYLFAGTAVDTRPAMGPDERITIADPTPLEMMDLVAADYFGVAVGPPLDAALAAATVADIDALTAEIDQVFAGTHGVYDFSAVFYAGSPDRVEGQIAPGVSADYGINADDPSLRELLKGLYMVDAFPPDRLNVAASNHLNELASTRMGGGMDDLIQDRANLGLNQEAVQRQSDRHEVERGIINNQIAEMETADPYDTAVRLNTLTAQLEATFATTARLSGLSLLNYLR